MRQTDPDLIVTHMAFQVFDMATAKAKLTEMGVPWRKNITVPQMDGSIVDQVTYNTLIEYSSSRKSAFPA